MLQLEWINSLINHIFHTCIGLCDVPKQNLAALKLRRNRAGDELVISCSDQNWLDL